MRPGGPNELAVFPLGNSRDVTAELVQMVEGYQRPAMLVLDRVQLEPRPAVKFAAIGDGILDRREFEKIILAFARSSEQQQHEPDGLQRVPP